MRNCKRKAYKIKHTESMPYIFKGLRWPNRANAVISVLGTSEKVLKHVSSMLSSSSIAIGAGVCSGMGSGVVERIGTGVGAGSSGASDFDFISVRINVSSLKGSSSTGVGVFGLVFSNVELTVENTLVTEGDLAWNLGLGVGCDSGASSKIVKSVDCLVVCWEAMVMFSSNGELGGSSQVISSGLCPMTLFAGEEKADGDFIMESETVISTCELIFVGESGARGDIAGLSLCGVSRQGALNTSFAPKRQQKPRPRCQSTLHYVSSAPFLDYTVGPAIYPRSSAKRALHTQKFKIAHLKHIR